MFSIQVSFYCKKRGTRKRTSQDIDLGQQITIQR